MPEEREDVETKSSGSPEVYQQTKFMAWFEKAFPWLLVGGAALGLVLMIFLPVIFFQEKTAEQLLAQSNLRLALLYTTGGVIAALGLLETYRKNTNDRTKANADINAALKNQEHQAEVLKEQIRQFDENAFKERKAERRERYTKAVEQLGSKEAPVRMGGVYTLVGLVDEWLEEESLSENEKLKEGQVIINNLCAYIRSPFTLASHFNELSRPIPTSEGVYKDKEQDFYIDKAELQSEANIRSTIVSQLHNRIKWKYKENYEFNPFPNEYPEEEYINKGSWSLFNYDFSYSEFFYPINFSKSYWGGELNICNTVYILPNSCIDFSNSIFVKNINFSGSKYKSALVLNFSKYKGVANFSFSTYEQGADFSSSIYYEDTFFNNSLYGLERNLTDDYTTIHYFPSYDGYDNTDFSLSIYNKCVDFSRSKYYHKIINSFSIYTDKSFFRKSIYCQDADFHGSIYFRDADFENSIYYHETIFRRSIYIGIALFSKSKYKSMKFEESKYFDIVDFQDSLCVSSAIFRDSIYSGHANFNGLDFLYDGTDGVDIHFDNSTYLKGSSFRSNKYNGYLTNINSIYIGSVYYKCPDPHSKFIFTHSLFLAEFEDFSSECLQFENLYNKYTYKTVSSSLFSSDRNYSRIFYNVECTNVVDSDNLEIPNSCRYISLREKKEFDRITEDFKNKIKYIGGKIQDIKKSSINEIGYHKLKTTVNDFIKPIEKLNYILRKKFEECWENF